MGIQDATSVIQAASALAIVLFAVFSYKTAKHALEESQRQADVAAAALAEAQGQAALSRAAVEAANASVVETRRQAQFNRIPFINLSRPRLGLDPSGNAYLEIIAANLGPGLALELRIEVDRQDHQSGNWYRDFQGTPTLPLLESEQSAPLQYSAASLRSMDADWEEGVRSVGTGVAPATQPIVPTSLRFTLTYLSVLNARMTQVHVWETDRIHLKPDPWTWRLDSLTIDPGPDNGAAIVVHRPD